MDGRGAEDGSMEEVVNNLSTPGVPEATTVAENLEREAHSVVEAANGRQLLWYPVGIFVALLAVSGMLVLCTGGWEG
jgi:hypothetical protein